MKRNGLKDALVAILVGASVAFLTSLIEGVGDLLNGYANNSIAAAVGGGTYWIKHIVSGIT